MLTPGVQDASRPRAGPSPPDRSRLQVHANLLPVDADVGHLQRRLVVSTRHLPVRPDLTQLKHQAKDFLRAIKKGDADAIADLRTHIPGESDPSKTTLADAQLALARSYGVASWPRLVAACNVIDAIWSDDLKTLRELIEKRPALIHEMARGTEICNWGPPMSYAANLAKDNIIKMLLELGATDITHAASRAALQGHVATARMLLSL